MPILRLNIYGNGYSTISKQFVIYKDNNAVKRNLDATHINMPQGRKREIIMDILNRFPCKVGKNFVFYYWYISDDARDLIIGFHQMVGSGILTPRMDNETLTVKEILNRMLPIFVANNL